MLRESIYDPGSSLTPLGQTHRTVEVAVIGTKTADQEGCRDEYGRIHNIGARYYREHKEIRVCGAPRIEEQRDQCYLDLKMLPEQMNAQMTELGRVSLAMDKGATNKLLQIDALPGRFVDKMQEVHDGKVTLRTMGEALKAKAISIAQHANTHDAKEWFKAKVAGVKAWGSKPGIEQAEDVGEQIGDALVPDPVAVAATVATGGIGRGVLRVAEEAADIGKLGKKARKVAAKKATTKVSQQAAMHIDDAAGRRLLKENHKPGTVSYTHLTLPTSDLV